MKLQCTAGKKCLDFYYSKASESETVYNFTTVKLMNML